LGFGDEFIIESQRGAHRPASVYGTYIASYDADWNAGVGQIQHRVETSFEAPRLEARRVACIP
jgi:hypothetical protein